ncbi:hypothetical protein SB49_02545 [Sediminicola sp. YIK13]|uniref:GLPGLI family protein n=1 Tax=Sediminicola sp. YIK13 TaxID=1453352 RepID=UPI0007200C89|nr:GLPGLI family protein [Sediminicola sp. YIK13]ALM06805.1 hypothetical protein SB49_02545 [Sediminicola sp. YIK13]
MKYLLIILLLFLGNLTQAQISEGKITYKATLEDHGFVEDSELTGFPKAIIPNKPSSSPIIFHLFFKDNSALYQAEYDLETKRKLGFKYNKTGVVAEHNRIYYNNLETKENYYQSFWTKDVLVNVENHKWNITKETKKIGDYICYKATTTVQADQIITNNYLKPVIAWFAPEIPISFGIQSFDGLPGLTMELITDQEKGKITYTVSNIELNPREEIKIVKPVGVNFMSETEYMEYINKLNANRF